MAILGLIEVEINIHEEIILHPSFPSLLAVIYYINSYKISMEFISHTMNVNQRKIDHNMTLIKSE